MRRLLITALVLSVAVVALTAPPSRADSCSNGVDWSISPDSPSEPPTFLGDARTIYAPVGTAASVVVHSVSANSCEWDVYFSDSSGSAPFEFPRGNPVAGAVLSRSVPAGGLRILVCYEKCTNQLSEWPYIFVPANGSVPAVPAKQTMGSGGRPCSCPAAGDRGSRTALNPTAMAGEPVNTATGAFVTTATDLRMGGSGYRFAADRTYNSNDTDDGVFGPGWSSQLGVSLTAAPDHSITLRAADGQRVVFPPLSPAGYARLPGVRATLVKSPTTRSSETTAPYGHSMRRARRRRSWIIPAGDSALPTRPER